MIASLIATLMLGQGAASDFQPTGPKIQVTMSDGSSFVITTDSSGSPKTVAHILGLVRRGFYDQQRVHRVESWVTQWGAPASRTKDLKLDEVTGGGSGKDIPFEESKWDFRRGVVGVASTGLQVGGDSQLFILKQDALRLYRSYAVVGKVTSGMDTVGRILKGDRIRSMRIVK